MAKKLAGYVSVGGFVYGPDDELPADVAKEITNPAAWAAGEDSDDGAEFPEGDPSESWTGKELDAYAASKSFDLGAAKTKAEKVAAIEAAAAQA